jgi:autophagy-related protein 33
LLGFPNPQAATRAFTLLRITTSRTHTLLAGTSITSLLLAYGLSPRGWRHPYLLWTSLVLLLTEGFGKDGSEGWWTWTKMRTGVITGEEFELAEREQEEGRVGDVNGEAVRGRMDDWGRGMAWRAAGWGLAFGMSVVGLWGDAFGV